jgi:carbohydrate-binding DOMON domain-containing protein
METNNNQNVANNANVNSNKQETNMKKYPVIKVNSPVEVSEALMRIFLSKQDTVVVAKRGLLTRRCKPMLVQYAHKYNVITVEVVGKYSTFIDCQTLFGPYLSHRYIYTHMLSLMRGERCNPRKCSNID